MRIKGRGKTRGLGELQLPLSTGGLLGKHSVWALCARHGSRRLPHFTHPSRRVVSPQFMPQTWKSIQIAQASQLVNRELNLSPFELPFWQYCDAVPPLRHNQIYKANNKSVNNKSMMESCQYPLLRTEEKHILVQGLSPAKGTKKRNIEQVFTPWKRTLYLAKFLVGTMARCWHMFLYQDSEQEQYVLVWS